MIWGKSWVRTFEAALSGSRDARLEIAESSVSGRAIPDAHEVLATNETDPEVLLALAANDRLPGEAQRTLAARIIAGDRMTGKTARRLAREFSMSQVALAADVVHAISTDPLFAEDTAMIMEELAALGEEDRGTEGVAPIIARFALDPSEPQARATALSLLWRETGDRELLAEIIVRARTHGAMMPADASAAVSGRLAGMSEEDRVLLEARVGLLAPLRQPGFEADWFGTGLPVPSPIPGLTPFERRFMDAIDSDRFRMPDPSDFCALASSRNVFVRRASAVCCGAYAHDDPAAEAAEDLLLRDRDMATWSAALRLTGAVAEGPWRGDPFRVGSRGNAFDADRSPSMEEFSRSIGDPSSVVRLAAAAHPSCPPSVLAAFQLDGDDGIVTASHLYGSAESQRSAQERMDIAMTRSDLLAKASATLPPVEPETPSAAMARRASKEDCPAEDLRRFASEWHPEVRLAAVCNPRFPRSGLGEAVGDILRSGRSQEAALVERLPAFALAELSCKEVPSLARVVTARIEAAVAGKADAARAKEIVAGFEAVRLEGSLRLPPSAVVAVGAFMEAASAEERLEVLIEAEGMVACRDLAMSGMPTDRSPPIPVAEPEVRLAIAPTKASGIHAAEQLGFGFLGPAAALPPKPKDRGAGR
ncbi:protein of unknown function (plasmid) [Magnetospirillum sp. XM-1]|uniref:hypothetical protein n=1 Tax=Magnetospirillum sp. XM-1 TaxID=1663591 RepID=UPI00073DC0EF|nr:hypothetical protein [Magnetospirillum sp. XM-1]CUW41933.1 protein of unknown function [Magnetospirillum sp. XM-1]